MSSWRHLPLAEMPVHTFPPRSKKKITRQKGRLCLAGQLFVPSYHHEACKIIPVQVLEA